MSVRDVLSDIQVASDLPSIDDFQTRFVTVAGSILNGMVLSIAGVGYRITEIEMYFNGGAHKDPFTHCSPDQGHSGMWYFHKVGNSYKGGTYKGLDIAIGTPEKSFGGILIRSIENLTTGETIEGPCRTVDTILKEAGAADIKSFVEKQGDLKVTACPALQLQAAAEPTLPQRCVFVGPRFGLTVRKPEAAPFFMAPYRFTTTPTKITKFRIGLALMAYLQAPDKFSAKSFNIQAGQWDQCLKAHIAGKAKSLEDFMDKPFKTNEDVAQALGALWPPPPTKPQDASGAGPAAAPAVPAAPKAPGGTKPVEKPGKKRAGSTADTAAKKQRKK